ncbi:Peptidoglycan biosynthesis protein MurJ protein [Dioscorea alata]|uniref:Peptidoglycan biosynthesis protein MurJ protein n=1 Tax=Dioscorea alata TaxID=55571 RepID=A0ACB7VAH2_DIOAL|nr:Peptidoglycan biosynthesis protein MurJ protein [Dioscorea alata]
MAIAELPSRHAAIRCRSVIHAHGSPPAAAETVNVRSSMDFSGKSPVSLRLSIASYSARKPLPEIIRCHRNPSSSSCVSSYSEGCSEDTSRDFTNDGLVRRASLVGAATIASKILGLVREIALASVIGVGPVATAFNHAVVLPRFSSSFLGAVKGPIHITAATTLSKLSSETRRQLTQKVQTIMLLIGGAFAALTYIFAEDIIFLTAPGLWELTNGQLIREMAMTQLKLMIPCILVAGSLGIGFGCLTAEGDDLLPSLSPSITSIAIIVSCAVYVLSNQSCANGVNNVLSGVYIACGTSMGSLLQLITQALIQHKTGQKPYSISWKDFFKNKHVHELFFLMIPATISSGLLQITSLTDLYFSSFVPDAHLLAMAPMGILSSIIVLPVVPIFARHVERCSWVSLKKSLLKIILLSMVVSLPITCTICVLARPLADLVFQRFAFDSAASAFVSSLLVCYSIGSPFWIMRKVFAAVFYSLAEGNWLFLINLTAIFLNGLLDWLSINVLGFGAQGLALSTSCITSLSSLALLFLLSKKICGMEYIKEVINPLLRLLSYCIFSGFITMISYKLLHLFLSSIPFLRFRLAELISILFAGFLGVSAFYLLLLLLPLPETMFVNDMLKTLINRKQFIHF